MVIRLFRFSKNMNQEAIILEVIKRYADSSSFNQSTRKREVVQERQLIHLFMKGITNKTHAYIAAKYGNKHYSTLCHSCRRVRDDRDTSKSFRLLLEVIMEELESKGLDLTRTRWILDTPNTRVYPKRKKTKK